MKDTLKRELWKILRFLLRHISPPESYRSMRARHEWEVGIFQKHCHHKSESFQFCPHVICVSCQKVLRQATDEEITRERGTFLKKLNCDVDKALKERVMV